MKKRLFVIAFLCFFINIFQVNATDTGCTDYIMAMANSDHTYNEVSCHNTFVEAQQAMNSSSDNNAIIVKDGIVVDAKYAVLNLDVGDASTNVTLFYPNDSGSSSYNRYMNTSSTYGGVDGAYLGVNPNNRIAKVKIAGYTGYVYPNDYEIVPFAWFKAASYYKVEVLANGDSNLWHMYASNVNIYVDPNRYRGRSFDLKPEMLNAGIYYSYDGIYFYSDRFTMIDDYRNNTYEHAVNKDKPYYNYYMYLPHHSKSTYSSLNIDEYIRDVLGKKGNGYATYLSNGYRWVTQGYSMMYGQGTFFYNAQERYGVNALLSFSLAQNESGTGTSNISFSKNNGFGHGAVDSDPYTGSKIYASFALGIFEHAYRWITYGYSEPVDSRFYGAVYGSKGIGMNIMWASDPYWSEKAASYYYDFDKAKGRNDYNYYQLAITNTEYVPAHAKADANSKFVYTLRYTNVPVIIVAEEKDVNGMLWYKIVSDLNIDSNYNAIGPDYNNMPYYNWEDNFVYVPAHYFNKINTAKDGLKSPLDTFPYEDQQYKYEYYHDGIDLKPLVGKVNNNAYLYYDSTLTRTRGITILKDKLVAVYAKAVDGEGKVKSYLVASNNNINQKEWIKASDITIVSHDLAKTVIDDSSNAITLYSNPTNTSSTVGVLYTNTFVAILDHKEVDGVMWLKVQNSLDTSSNDSGWIKTVDNGYSVQYTITRVNKPPVINAIDQTILINTSFDPLKGVSVTDPEDGPISNDKLTIIGKVESSVIGTYTLTYKVADSEGLETVKIVTIKVVDYESKEGLFSYNAITNIDKTNKFEVSGFLGIKGIDNTQSDAIKHKLILKNSDTNKEYSFDLAMWKSGYPYEMSSSTDDQVYNYNGGWFKDTVDLSSVPAGEYKIYIEMTNGNLKTRRLFNNLFFKDCPRKVTTSDNRGYQFEMNYYSNEVPLELFIKDNGLISDDLPPTIDLMYNSFHQKITFDNNKLNILGYSYNVNGDYSKSKDIKRSIIFENVNDYTKRFSMDVGYIDNGPYTVTLAVPDGYDKTRVWYDAKLDISSLEPGVYAIYVKTETPLFTDYGELRDIFYKDISSVMELNNKRYSLQNVADKRYRIELLVEAI